MKRITAACLIAALILFLFLACDDSSSSSDDDTTPDDDDDDNNDDETDDDGDDDIDDDTTPGIACYSDADEDGYGDPDSVQYYSDECPPLKIEVGGDCNDDDPYIFPGAPELAGDGIDQDCNGVDLTPSDEVGVFVAKTGNDANPGTMTQPKLTITAGVEAAKKAGKAAFVAEGTYEEIAHTEVSLYGGYEATGWTRDIDAHQTTIKADEDICLHVDGSYMAIEGFTTDPLTDDFPGVSVGHQEHIIIHRNVLNGGIFSVANPTIVSRNTLTEGKNYDTLIMSSANSVIVDNLIYGASAMLIERGQTVIMHNTIHIQFTLDRPSAGILLQGATSLVFNNLIIDESLGLTYGVISLGIAPYVELYNNHFQGMGLFNYVNTYTDLAEVNACSWSGCMAAQDNQDGDPLLSDEVHLTATSPCVEAGADTASHFSGFWIDYDFDGDARPFGENWDIGMDEFMP